MLSVNGKQFAVAQVGPEFITLRKAQDFKKNQSAELHISVDGRVFHWDVFLPHGAVPFDEDVLFTTKPPIEM